MFVCVRGREREGVWGVEREREGGGGVSREERKREGENRR